jgi:uncharacterized LabA/DUF88 family protein
MKLLWRKPPQQPRVIVLVDYENVAREAALQGEVVDFEKLASLCRSFGKVIASFLFVPGHMTQSQWLLDACNHGFFVVVSSPSRNGATPAKQKDTADTSMISLGRRLSASVDTAVIVSNDSDFLTLANDLKDMDKQVVLVHGAGVSSALKEVVKLRYPLPLRGM